MFNEQFAEADLPMDYRFNLESDSKFVDLKKRPSVWLFSAAYYDAIQVSSQSRKIKVEGTNLRATPRRAVSLFDNLAHRKLLKSAASQVEISGRCPNHNQSHQACQCPANSLF